MTAYRELIERLEKATGPDRELDAAIGAALGQSPSALAFRPPHIYPVYTASIDAALSLVEKMLPRFTRSVDATTPELGIAVDLHPPGTTDNAICGDHALEPIATCIALLRALEAQSKDKEEGE